MLLHTVRWLWSEDQWMLFTVVVIRLRFNTFRSESPVGGTAKLRNLCHPECAPLAPPLGNRRQCKLLSSRRLVSAANGSETGVATYGTRGECGRTQNEKLSRPETYPFGTLIPAAATKGMVCEVIFHHAGLEPFWWPPSKLAVIRFPAPS